jgi:hypothetical protein
LKCLIHLGLPVLEYRDTFLGATDYLDGITSLDLNYPIMIGRDCYKRGFIAIRYRCLDHDWTFDERTYPLSPDKTHCLILFQ